MKQTVVRLALVAGAGLCAVDAEPAVRRVPGQHPTIQQAVNAAASGDTVVVAEGTYREAVTLKGGIRLHAAENADVVIDASGVTVPGPVDYVVGWTATSDRIEVVGFTLVEDNISAGVGILARGSNHLIEDNVIKGAFRDGIRLGSAANITVLGNEIWGTRDTGEGTATLAGIVLNNGSRNRVLNNFAFSGRRGIAILGGGSNFVAGNVGFAGSFFGMIGVLVRNSQRNVLANNTAYADGAEGATGLQVEAVTGLLIVNCILTGSDTGLRLIGSSSVRVTSTLVEGGQTDVGGAGAVFGIGVLLGVDPKLASPIEGDFRLQQGSPARDAGLGRDRDGSRADLGAYGGVY
jgi:parallel beta-helix repeat protein